MTKILIIDDQQELIEIVKEYLELKGYQVCTASDGEKALSVFDKEQPDLVITDILMPQVDGIEIIRHVKHHDPNSTIKIIAMSGGGRIDGLEYLRYAKRLGADEVLDKPINLAMLFTKIEQLLTI